MFIAKAAERCENVAHSFCKRHVFLTMVGECIVSFGVSYLGSMLLPCVLGMAHAMLVTTLVTALIGLLVGLWLDKGGKK